MLFYLIQEKWYNNLKSNDIDMEDQKSKFIKVYANLPIKIRNEIVLLLDEKEGGPITWNASYIEINNDTKLGDKILKKLLELEII